jgi:hypothetical protein
MEPFLGGREQLRQIVLQASDDVQSQIVSIVEEGSAGEFPIHDHIVGKAPAEVADGAAHESPRGVVLAISRAVRFHI